MLLTSHPPDKGANWKLNDQRKSVSPGDSFFRVSTSQNRQLGKTSWEAFSLEKYWILCLPLLCLAGACVLNILLLALEAIHYFLHSWDCLIYWNRGGEKSAITMALEAWSLRRSNLLTQFYSYFFFLWINRLSIFWCSAHMLRFLLSLMWYLSVASLLCSCILRVDFP